MKKIFIITGALIATLSGNAAAYAQDNALTVQGISIGMSSADVSALLGPQNENWTPAPVGTSRGETAERAFSSENEQRITISFGGPVQNQSVSAVRYDYGLIQAQGEVLENSLTRRFGAPAANYTLNEDAALLVWERPAPTSGKELGRLVTVALQTGPQGSLTLSRFDRPDFNRPASPSPSAAAVPSLPRAGRFGEGATD